MSYYSDTSGFGYGFGLGTETEEPTERVTSDAKYVWNYEGTVWFRVR